MSAACVFARRSSSSRRQFPRFILGLLIFELALSVNGGLALAHGPSPSGPNPTADSLTNTLLALSAQHRQASPAHKAQIESQLLATATARYQFLASLIEDDPGEVLRVALPAALRAALPPAVRAYVEEEVEAEGTLEVLHAHQDGGSRYLYFLDTAAERLSLHFAADPPELQTGSRVRARGMHVRGALALGSGKGNVTTVSPAVSSTRGEQRTLVILVNFSDDPTEPYTLDEARSVVFATTSQFFLENSFEQTWLTGDVVGWYTIPLSVTVCDSSTLASQAKSAASTAGVDLTAYTRYVYAYSNACGGLGLGTVGGNPSQAWINGSLDLSVLAHELGHNLGLYHSHAMDCGNQVLGPSCTIYEYGDRFDAMGNIAAGHFNAFHKERLGWLNAEASPQITTVLAGGTYTLEAYERAGSGPNALKILRSTDPSTGKRTWYYVESRQAIGFDGFLAENANVVNGVLIHTGSESSADSSYLLDMTPASGSLVVYDWRDPALGVGQSFYDPESGVTLTTDWVTGTEAAVTVRFDTPVVTAESMTISTDQASYTVGQSVSITATVRSGDSPVPNANVTFTVTKSSGTVTTGNATTGSNGKAVYKMRLKRQDPVGIYQAGAAASKDGQSASAITSFAVQ